MTYYFDEMARRMNATEKLPFPENVEALRVIETELVFDVSVCIMCEGFPTELRDRANLVMLEHCVESRCVNDADNPRVDTVEDLYREMHYLCGDLHTVFHDVVTNYEARGAFEKERFNFSDDPRSPLRQLASRAETLREEVVAKRSVKTGPADSATETEAVDE